MSTHEYPLITPTRPIDILSDPADLPQVSLDVMSTASPTPAPPPGPRSQHTPVHDIIPDGDDDLMSTMSSHVGIMHDDVLSIPAPPEFYNPFWHWIRTNFTKYFSNELYDVMTTLLYCTTTDQLELTLNQISPAQLAQRMGSTKYETWREQLADLQIIVNFAGTYFWANNPDKNPVPFDKWLSYRAEVYSFALRAFPTNPHDGPPPVYTAVSPLVERERSRSHRDSARRSQRSQRTSRRDNRSVRSYHSSAPHLPDTDDDTLPTPGVRADYSGQIRHPGERVMANSRVHGCAGTAANVEHPLHPPGGDQQSEDRRMTGYSNDDQSTRSRSTRSQLSRRSLAQEPWNKPEKVRSKINEKVVWNGSRATFREYRKSIEGHLLQVNAGYLIDTNFLTDYMEHQAVGQHRDYLNSEAFWAEHNVSFAQAKSDKQYLYGILVSTSRLTDNKVILENKKELDGIRAWSQMIRDYGYGGSIELRVSDLDDEVHRIYMDQYPVD